MKSRSVLHVAGVLAVVVALVLAPVSPAVMSVAGQSGPPEGMVGLSNSQIAEDVPSGESIPLSAADLEGKVYANQHAETMSLTLTTAGRAKEIMGTDSAALSGDKMSLVLADNQHHEARDVAIESTTLEQALGYVPKYVFGTHDDGSRWARPTTYKDGYLVFTVPEFSSNTVQFSGEISVQSSAATNGTKYTYDISDTAAVSNFTIDLTGTTAGEWDNESHAAVGNGGTIPLSIAGDQAPIGPGGGPPVVEFIGRSSEFAETATGTAAAGDTPTVSVGGDEDPTGPSASGQPTIEFHGKKKTVSDSASVWGATDGASSSVTVGGNEEPTGPASGSPQVTFNGAETTSVGDQTWEWVGAGSSKPLSNPGNVAPRGPSSNGKPTLMLTGITVERSGGGSYSSATGTSTLSSSSGDGEVYLESVPSGAISYVELHHLDSDTSVTVDVYLAEGDQVDGSVGDGSLVASDVSLSGSGTHTISIPKTDLSTSDATIGFVYKSGNILRFNADGDGDGRYSYLGSTFTKSLEIKTGSEPTGVSASSSGAGTVSYGDMSGSGSVTKEFPIDSSASSISFSADGGMIEATIEKTDVTATEDPAIDVDGDGTADVTHNGVLSSGQSASYAAPGLSTGTQTVTASVSSGSSVDYTLDFTENYVTENPAVDVTGDGTMDVQYTGKIAAGNSVTKEIAGLPSGSPVLEFQTATHTVGYTIRYDRIEHTENPAVDVDGDGTNDASFTGTLAPGQSATKEVPGLSTATSSVTASTATGTQADYIFRFKERQSSYNPAVYVNGQKTSYSGTLSSGTTTAITTDASWITTGTNEVVVETGSPSSDAPDSTVTMDYSHDAASEQTIDYTSEAWSERYNVSKTFAADQSDVSLTVPFKSERVVAVRGIQVKENGGAWQDVAPGDYSFDGTTLSVNIGGVKAGDSLAVRATGSKVKVVNGAIEVTNPTVEGDVLETEFTVESRSSGFEIDVSGTRDTSRLHYIESASWQNPSPYAEVGADGTQVVRMPNAAAGSTGRIATAPVEPIAMTGDVRIGVTYRDGQREYDIEPGPTPDDRVKFVYYDTVSGKKYLLESLTNDVVRDSDTAQSPVTLWDDDSQETLVIRQETETNATGGGGGPAGGGFPVPQSPSGGDTVLIILGIVVAVAVLAFLSWRFGSGSDDPEAGASGKARAAASRASSATDQKVRGALSGTVGRIPVVGGALSTLFGWFVGTPVRFVAGGATRVATTVGNGAMNQRIITAGLALIGLVVVAQYNLVDVPGRAVTLALLIGTPVVAVLAMRRTGTFSLRLFGVVVALTLLFGVGVLSDTFFDSLAGGLVEILPIVVIVVGFLMYQAFQAWKSPEEQVTLSIRGGGK